MEKAVAELLLATAGLEICSLRLGYHLGLTANLFEDIGKPFPKPCSSAEEFDIRCRNIEKAKGMFG